MSEFEDRLNHELSSGMLIQSWRDGSDVFLCIGIITICLSVEDYRELVKVLYKENEKYTHFSIRSVDKKQEIEVKTE